MNYEKSDNGEADLPKGIGFLAGYLRRSDDVTGLLLRHARLPLRSRVVQIQEGACLDPGRVGCDAEGHVHPRAGTYGSDRRSENVDPENAPGTEQVHLRSRFGRRYPAQVDVKGARPSDQQSAPFRIGQRGVETRDPSHDEEDRQSDKRVAALDLCRGAHRRPADSHAQVSVELGVVLGQSPKCGEVLRDPGIESCETLGGWVR